MARAGEAKAVVVTVTVGVGEEMVNGGAMVVRVAVGKPKVVLAILAAEMLGAKAVRLKVGIVMAGREIVEVGATTVMVGAGLAVGNATVDVAPDVVLVFVLALAVSLRNACG